MRTDQRTSANGGPDLLTTVLDEAFVGPRPEGVHVVAGSRRVALARDAIYDSARAEICRMHRSPAPGVDGPAGPRAAARGVRRREVLAENSPRRALEPGARHIDDRRLFVGRPFLVLIADRRRALVRWPTAERAGSAVLVGRSGLLDVLVESFESLWGRAERPLDAEQAVREDDRAADRDILRLLASGATDVRIGHALHLSTRTVQRRVRRLLDELGAETRFQAGIAAAKRRLI